MKNNTPWELQERSVTLTNSDWNRLVCYLLMTTKYREGERDAWGRLAKEVDASGAPRFPHAASNAEYWSDLIDFLAELEAKIDGVGCSVLKGER